MRFLTYSILFLVIGLGQSLPALPTHARSQAKADTASSISKGHVQAVAHTRKGAAKVPKVVIAKTAAPAGPVAPVAKAVPNGYLARLTAYWTQEDYWTSRHMSSTGVHLQEGHCAVDPSRIPYGSMVQIPGMGSYLAVDTGSAVVSRQAAKGAAHNAAERNALVVDLFFENRKDAERFAQNGPSYAAVVWTKPTSANVALASRAQPVAPVKPAIQIDALSAGPSFADVRMPMNFRAPQM